MDKLKNKNVIILIISAILILIAILVAAVATASANKEKKEKTTTSTEESVSIDLGSIADLNNVPTSKKAQQASYSYEPGKYKIATKDDPLGLRLEPNTTSDRLIYVPKGHEVEVIAVWEDWGYVVYEKTGGWLSMNYLELVSGSKKPNTTETATTASEQ